MIADGGRHGPAGWVASTGEEAATRLHLHAGQSALCIWPSPPPAQQNRDPTRIRRRRWKNALHEPAGSAGDELVWELAMRGTKRAQVARQTASPATTGEKCPGMGRGNVALSNSLYDCREDEPR